MSEIITLLSKPFFWIVSVVFSLALSVIGNLLTPKISALLEQRNTAKQNVSIKAKAMKMGEVLLRFESPEKVTQTMVSSVYSLVLACFFLLAAIGLLTGASVISSFSSHLPLRILLIAPCVPLVWLAQFLLSESIKWHQIANIAYRRRQALDDFHNKGSRTRLEDLDFLKEWDEKRFGITYDEVKVALTVDTKSTIPSQNVSDGLGKK
jgi:hypothetical protein